MRQCTRKPGEVVTVVGRADLRGKAMTIFEPEYEDGIFTGFYWLSDPLGELSRVDGINIEQDPNFLAMKFSKIPGNSH